MFARTTSGLLILLMATVGCGDTGRPDTATWLSKWGAVTSAIPEMADLGDPPDAGLCESALAAVRAGNEDLLPSPVATVDDLVTEWVAVAQAAFFDCPPAGAVIDSFATAYDELERIEETIDSALSENEDRP